MGPAPEAPKQKPKEESFIVPTLAPEKIAAVVTEKQIEDAIGSKSLAFDVELPKHYQYPALQQLDRWNVTIEQKTPEAGVVASGFSADVERIGEDIKETGRRADEYGYDFTLSSQDGEWSLDTKTLPEPIVRMIKTALAHEASINPDLSRYEAHINIRVQEPYELNRLTNDARKPHRDYAMTSSASIYILTSAPTTNQYAGTYKPSMQEKYTSTGYLTEQTIGEDWMQEEAAADQMNWSSLLPWTLYRVTPSWMHSTPVADDYNLASFPRLFVRIAFVPE